MTLGKLSKKGQITVPKEVRDALHAKPGDILIYEVEGNRVLLRKMEPFDVAFHDALSGTLTEWADPKDDEAFRDL